MPSRKSKNSSKQKKTERQADSSSCNQAKNSPEKLHTFKNKYFKFLEKYYKREVSGIGLGLFRIGFGIILLLEIVQLFELRHLVFDYVPYFGPYEFSPAIALGLWGIVCLCVTLGLFTRIAVVANYLATVSVLGVLGNWEYHADWIYISCGLMFFVIPASDVLSLDNLRYRIFAKSDHSLPKPRYTQLHYIFFAYIVLGLLYFDSIFQKLAFDMWPKGLAVWLPASLPWASPQDVTQILNQEWLMRIGSWLTLFFEAIFIFLVWWGRARLPLLVTGLSLHFGIFIAFPIPYFAFLMIVLYLLMLPWSWYSQLEVQIDKFLKPLSDNIVSGMRGVLPRYLQTVQKYQPNPNFKFIAMAVILVVFSLNQLLIISRSQLLRDKFWNRSQQIALSYYNHYSGVFTGMYSHGVFLDPHFEGYNHVVAVAHEKIDGTLEYLPVTKENGLVGDYIRGRVWAYWSFRANNNKINQNQMVRGLQRFTAFWAYQKKLNLDGLKFKVLVKKIKVSWEYEKDLLSKNMSQPWIDAGYVEWTSGGFSSKNLKIIESI